MNLYYAIGGGLGHLTRARAFLENFGIEKETAILTASEFAKDKRVVGDIKILEVSKSFALKKVEYRDFLQKVLNELEVKTLYLDSFPFGIQGEFKDFDFSKTELIYIARLLDWKNYLKFNASKKAFSFDKSYILEELEKEHFGFIRKLSGETINLKLDYPKPFLNEETRKIINEIKQKKNFWLVVHSVSADELYHLIYYADEQRKIEKRDVELIIITPMDLEINIPKTSVYDLYPASVLFQYAERIFSACGFNVMQQTAKYRNKHYFIPFQRRFDKQFLRAKRFGNLLDS